MRKRRSDDPRKWHGMSLTSLRLLSKAHCRNSPSSIRANNAHLLPSYETRVQNALTTGTRYKANKDAILTWLAMVCYHHLRCTSTARVSLTEGCADKAADNASMSSAGLVPHPRSDRRDGRPPETSHTTSTTSPPLHAACSQELAELGSLQTSYQTADHSKRQRPAPPPPSLECRQRVQHGDHRKYACCTGGRTASPRIWILWHSIRRRTVKIFMERFIGTSGARPHCGAAAR